MQHISKRQIAAAAACVFALPLFWLMHHTDPGVALPVSWETRKARVQLAC